MLCAYAFSACLLAENLAQAHAPTNTYSRPPAAGVRCAGRCGTLQPLHFSSRSCRLFFLLQKCKPSNSCFALRTYVHSLNRDRRIKTHP
ncbi:hypothetical protein B0J12DRAFT_637999 [Macrophomina phaseolina]|uniref:Secreted protein n=1 Tax=Macrophomina phaseolina TaxID=35725 RepID=A0ABQ8GU57_9PEZI|nr:hypothetical protein B0J12DRAFT_637999 [Macrophomina phaseolina]